MRFFEPESIHDVFDLLTEDPDGTKIIAGGTAVVLMLQQKLIAPARLVSLARIPDFDIIEVSDDGVMIGPMIRLSAAATAPLIRQQYPALAKACGMVGNVRVRNQATLGGNIVEADYASDPPTVLLALDARVMAADTLGGRSYTLDEFILGFYTTALAPDRVIESVSIPALPPNTHMTYLKYKSRSSEDRPCAGVAAVATFDGERCTDLRVAVGAACEVPRRLAEIEGMARGQALTDALIAEIAEGYAANIETLDDLRGSAWYRTQMIRVHVRRALEEVRDGNR